MDEAPMKAPRRPRSEADMEARRIAAREYYRRNKRQIKERDKLRSTSIKEKRREWYAEKGAEYYAKRKIERTPELLLASAKNRAKKLDVPFTITVSDIIVPELCPYLKIPLTFISGKGQQWTNPSLDRIAPELGYVPGNVRVISRLANTMKSIASREQLLQFARSVIRLHGEPVIEWPDQTLPSINLWNASRVAPVGPQKLS